MSCYRSDELANLCPPIALAGHPVWGKDTPEMPGSAGKDITQWVNLPPLTLLLVTWVDKA